MHEIYVWHWDLPGLVAVSFVEDTPHPKCNETRTSEGLPTLLPPGNGHSLTSFQIQFRRRFLCRPVPDVISGKLNEHWRKETNSFLLGRLETSK
jgi:hypothetical protein